MRTQLHVGAITYTVEDVIDDTGTGHLLLWPPARTKAQWARFVTGGLVHIDAEIETLRDQVVGIAREAQARALERKQRSPPIGPNGPGVPSNPDGLT